MPIDAKSLVLSWHVIYSSKSLNGNNCDTFSASQPFLTCGTSIKLAEFGVTPQQTMSVTTQKMPKTIDLEKKKVFSPKTTDFFRYRGDLLKKFFQAGNPQLSAAGNCNCNYVLFTKFPWPGDSEETFQSSSQAAAYPPVYHTRWRLHTVPLIAERQAGKL